MVDRGESPIRKALAAKLTATIIPPILMQEMTKKLGQKVVANLPDS